MKLLHVDRSILGNRSFTVQHLREKKDYLKVWHYHKELELVVVLNSRGTRLVGDNISRFKEQDVVLLGPNIPHLWMFDDFLEEKEFGAEILVIHFGSQFLNLSLFPEFRQLEQLFLKAQRGISFSVPNFQFFTNTIKSLMSASPDQSMMGLLSMLIELSQNTSQEILSKQRFLTSLEGEDPRLNKVYEYIFSNFKKDISLAKLAELVNMNPSAFSRFFSKTTNKTLTKFINEVRINFASRLLLEKQLTISQVCFASGFNNISNFNRQFRTITGITPKEYIKEYEAHFLKK